MWKIILALLGIFGFGATNRGKAVKYALATQALKIEKFANWAMALGKVTVALVILPLGIGIAAGGFGMTAAYQMAVVMAIGTGLLALTAVWRHRSLASLPKSTGLAKELANTRSKIGGRSVLTVMLIIVSIGLSGQANYDDPAAVGQWFVRMAAVLGTIGVTIFRIWLLAAIEALGLASAVAKAIHKKAPYVPMSLLDSLFSWASGYAAWAIAIGVFVSTFPVFMFPKVAVTVVMTLAFMSAAFSAKWTTSDTMRIWTIRMVKAIAVAYVFLAVVPSPIQDWTSAKVGLVSGWCAQDNEVRKIEDQIAKDESDANVQVLRVLAKEKADIEIRLTTQCRGKFEGQCATDGPRYAQILRDIEVAKDKKYIQQQAGLKKDDDRWKKLKGWFDGTTLVTDDDYQGVDYPPKAESSETSASKAPTPIPVAVTAERPLDCSATGPDRHGLSCLRQNLANIPEQAVEAFTPKRKE